MGAADVRTELAADGGWQITLHYAGDGLLTLDMTQDLLKALRAVPKEAKFAVLQAEGPDFCAGRQSPTPKGGRVSFTDLRERVADPVLGFYQELRALPVPLICVVRGRALGVGCALAGLGDVILADDSARFGIPEMERDIPPLLVMTALADRVAHAHLAHLVLSRAEIGAAEAERIGLVSRACLAAELEGKLAALRATLSTNSRVVTATVKRFLNLAPELSFEQRREYAATANPGAMTERFLG